MVSKNNGSLSDTNGMLFFYKQKWLHIFKHLIIELHDHLEETLALLGYYEISGWPQKAHLDLAFPIASTG